MKRKAPDTCTSNQVNIPYATATTIGTLYNPNQNICADALHRYECTREDTKSELNEYLLPVISNMIMKYAKEFKGIGITEACIFNTHGISCITVLPNGKLATGTCDHTIQVWQMYTNTYDLIPIGQISNVPLLLLRGHTDEIVSVVVLPNGDLASASKDHNIRIWDPTNGECKQLMKGDSGPIWSLQVLHNGDLASGSNSHIIRVWNIETGECKKELKTQESALHMAVLPNGHLIYTDMCYVSAYNTHTGDYTTIISQARRYGRILCMVVLPNGDVATGRDKGTIQVWNLETGECRYDIQGHTNCVTSLAVLLNGDLVSSADDNTIRVWNTLSGECKSVLQTSDWVEWMTVLPNGDLASASCGSVRIWT